MNEAIELGQQNAFSRPLWLAYYTLVHVRLAYGDHDDALTMFQQAQHYQRLHSLPVPVRLIQAQQVRTWLALGQLELAEHWARTCDAAGTSSPDLVQEFENITLARVYLSQNQFEKALTLLYRIRLEADSNDHNRHLIEIFTVESESERQVHIGLV